MSALFAVLIATILRSAVVDAKNIARDLGEENYKTSISSGSPLYDELKVNALGYGNKALEEKIYDSMQETRNFFGEISDPLKVSGLVVKSAAIVPEKLITKAAIASEELIKKAAKFIPFAAQLIDIADTFAGIFEVKSDWKLEFAKEFENLMPKQQVLEKSNDIGAFLKTVKQNIPAMNATIYKNAILMEKLETRNRSPQEKHQNYHQRHNQRLRQHLPVNPKQRKFQKPKRQPNQQSENKRLSSKVETLEIELQILKQTNGAMPTVLHTFFQTYINLITATNSTFNRFPLLAAPIFVEFSLMLSVFEPMEMQLIKEVASSTKLTCMLRDALMNFLPFVVAARLEALNIDFEDVIKVRNEPYNAEGYTKTSSLPCYPFPCVKQWGDDPNIVKLFCVNDRFSTHQYFPMPEYLSQPEPGPAVIKGATNCKIKYAQYLRGVVEKMFPIDMLNRSCSRELGSPTGSGWATIRLKNFRGTHLEEATIQANLFTNHCDFAGDIFSKCDPFVRMKIDGENVLTTDPKYNTESYDVGRTVVSGKIKKNSTIIEVEVLDVPSIENSKKPQLMLKKTGTVESFMQTPVQCTKDGETAFGMYYASNCLEIDIIWQDERNTEPVPNHKTSTKSSAKTSENHGQKSKVTIDSMKLRKILQQSHIPLKPIS